MSENLNEKRNVVPNNQSPEVLTNNIYTPAFLRDRTGILEDVGVSYILLRSIESGNLLYCDIYSIKFVSIAEYPYRPGMYNY